MLLYRRCCCECETPQGPQGIGFGETWAAIATPAGADLVGFDTSRLLADVGTAAIGRLATSPPLTPPPDGAFLDAFDDGCLLEYDTAPLLMDMGQDWSVAWWENQEGTGIPSGNPTPIRWSYIRKAGTQSSLIISTAFKTAPPDVFYIIQIETTDDECGYNGIVDSVSFDLGGNLPIDKTFLCIRYTAASKTFRISCGTDGTLALTHQNIAWLYYLWQRTGDYRFRFFGRQGTTASYLFDQISHWTYGITDTDVVNLYASGAGLSRTSPSFPAL